MNTPKTFRDLKIGDEIFTVTRLGNILIGKIEEINLESPEKIEIRGKDIYIRLKPEELDLQMSPNSFDSISGFDLDLLFSEMLERYNINYHNELLEVTSKYQKYIDYLDENISRIKDGRSNI